MESLKVYLNEYGGPLRISGPCSCIGRRTGDPHHDDCQRRMSVSLAYLSDAVSRSIASGEGVSTR